MSFTKLLRKIATGYSELPTERKGKAINITPSLSKITVKHKGKDVVIERNQDTHARINDMFAKTSRPCPPFCVQPLRIVKGVETLAELEMIDYIEKASSNESIMIIDSRIKEWVDMGTIPSAKHIPWTALALGGHTSAKQIIAILQKSFGVTLKKEMSVVEISEAFEKGTMGKKLDFSKAKTLVMFCNGSWCGQTPEAVRALLDLNYPAKKLKYYRDGMQGWLALGLTTIANDKSANDKVEPACKLIMES